VTPSESVITTKFIPPILANFIPAQISRALQN
jgi:hypothetical protein